MRSLVAALTLALAASSLVAQAPDSLSHQGLLTDPSGVPVADGNYNFVFALYDTPSGGSPIWTETQNGANAIPVEDGIFNAVLGRLTSLSGVTFNKPLYLGVSVSGDPEMVPRTSLTAAPYARALPGLYTFYREVGDLQSYNVVGGAPNNSVGASVTGATIGGGGGTVLAQEIPNAVNADFGTVGGGFSNSASGDRSTVGGGSSNGVGSFAGVVAGGEFNSASGSSHSTVGGGESNTASASFATVPGGRFNTAGGTASFAAGTLAKANHEGSFVWQDRSNFFLGQQLASTASNQFLARAAGGFFLFTGGAPDTLAGAELPAGSGTWGALSSRSSKTDFNDVDTRTYLERVASLALKEWSYKTEGGVTHVGPMAEDFYAAFGHGPSERSISTVDADGVALAAIQGLYELVKELQFENERMREALRRAGIE